MFLQLCSMLSNIQNLIFVNVWRGQHSQIRSKCQLIFRKLWRSIV